MTTEVEPTILLVDDEENILAALRRVLRREGYRILTASSGQAGLDALALHKVDVIVSDQRMPGMTGVEFLRQAKELYPDTVRIVLSGYTELHSITDAINEGSIYKYLTKPWEDDLIRANIAEAFRHKALADDNLRLNRELARTNEELQALLLEKQHSLKINAHSLTITQEVLHQVPFPLLGVDDDGLMVFANSAADSALGRGQTLIGERMSEQLPPELLLRLSQTGAEDFLWPSAGVVYRVLCHRMGSHSHSQGRLLLLLPPCTDFDAAQGG